MSVFKKAGLGLVMGATLLSVAAPAEAQRRYYRGRDNGGAALAAGIAGLAVGAAIASSGRDRYYDRGYDRRYYRGGYDRGWRGGWRDRGYYRERCWTERQWDPYYGHPVRVRYCR